MVKRLVEPLYLTKYLVKIGDDNYEAAVDSLTFTPSSSRSSWVGGDGGSYTASSIATWEVGVGFAQDFVTPEGLTRYLLENEGKAETIEYTPQDGNPESPLVRSVVTLSPGMFGGSVNNWAGSTATFGSTRPEIIDPVPTP